ncbi:hypothetical protein SAMN05660236_2178 [Ohtaekwangia koreensis]|uniref:Uncharacterized protein n=1 Tax=Ohtaekwangia koreensis TaxID=688867 RepID=A0A1T5KHZ3_9BACT|nr:hypothetical protein SAMN05660236_2178 [Ohtaekwangia koreensis]
MLVLDKTPTLLQVLEKQVLSLIGDENLTIIRTHLRSFNQASFLNYDNLLKLMPARGLDPSGHVFSKFKFRICQC